MKRLLLTAAAVLFTFAAVQAGTISLGTGDTNLDANNWSVFYLGTNGNADYENTKASQLKETFDGRDAEGSTVISQSLKKYGNDEYPVNGPWETPFETPKDVQNYYWIGAEPGGNEGNFPGYYAFVLTITEALTGDLYGVIGNIATDNHLFGIFLNGVQIGGLTDSDDGTADVPVHGESYFGSKGVNGNFELVDGKNTLVFLVGSWNTGGEISAGNQDGNPVGLYSTLEFTTDVAATPEPGTLALFGLGLAGMAFSRRRAASCARA